MKQTFMTYDQAVELVAHIGRERARWGKQYTGDDIGLDKLLAACTILATEGSTENMVPKSDLTTANRQLAAAKARETKLRNQLDEVIADNRNMQRELNKRRDGTWDNDEG